MENKVLYGMVENNKTGLLSGTIVLLHERGRPTMGRGILCSDILFYLRWDTVIILGTSRFIWDF